MNKKNTKKDNESVPDCNICLLSNEKYAQRITQS